MRRIVFGLSLLWPRSLRGQVLLAIALGLFLAQGIGALLLYRAQHERIEGALVHTAAFRMVGALRGDLAAPDIGRPPASGEPRGRPGRVDWTAASPLAPGELRRPEDESELREVLAEQDVAPADLVVFRRAVAKDPPSAARAMRRFSRHGETPPDEVLIAAMRQQGSPTWLVTRVFVPPAERLLLTTLLGQTLFIYAALVGAMWLLLRRITRPLAALTARLERFAETRDRAGQLTPEGPDDIARLIGAHNAMEDRIATLLNEKDVMLGAIGHDLKTPLAALRVRIESVDDETERRKMAATIEDITRTLDDILSLARVGRPSDPAERTELSALVLSVVEEYEDMGQPVALSETSRIALTLRPTWIRRALRNLIGNALRYGRSAEVSVMREDDMAAIRIVDRGPGIPDGEIVRMLAPFTRGEPSRNSETGGAGLGLTLARAIAEQHGGSLLLANRHGTDGTVNGLEATLLLPLR
ncbi:MAG TPA: HAMP domain-containing sensor histidine kinase [Novosphingobium sp.]|nr:HAMP domain-containing sensor histidine kinase [Novosphingobium sp.]